MASHHLDPEALLAAIVDSSDDAIVAKDLNGVVTAWNPAAERMFGYTAAEVIGRSITIVIPSERLSEEEFVLGQIRRGQSVRHFETVRRRKDGSFLDISLTVSPIKNANGDIVGASKIARNITDRKRFERDAFRLAAIVESSDDAIISKDLNGTIQTWNLGAERIFGYLASEAIGKPIILIIPADRMDEEAMVLTRVRNGQRVDHFETVRVAKNGRLVELSITVSPVRTLTGEIIGASKIARDVTEQKRLTRQLERTNRLKDEFLATLSHELRTPLNAILGYARLLRGHTLHGEDRERGLEVVERNAQSLAQLVSEVLDVSRIITGKIRLEVQRCELGRIVDATVESLEPMISAKQIKLERFLDPSTPAVAGDRDRLQQILWNLLTNAIKFTPENGRVEVRVAEVNGHVELTVRDSGIGIAPEFVPHLFERFTQADTRSTREYGGLGLGLALVRHFVELHGGTVHAFSAGANQGATFRVDLPVMSARRTGVAADTRRAVPGTPRLAGVTVLAVDDDPDSLMLVNDALETAGASVLSAGSAVAALAILDTERPDVIVSDIGMPQMDGLEFIERVRQREQSRGGCIPAAALTAFAGIEDRHRSLRAGFQVHLAKPIEPSELVSAVATLVKSTSAESQ